MGTKGYGVANSSRLLFELAAVFILREGCLFCDGAFLDAEF